MRLIDESELIDIIQGSDELLDFQKAECIKCIEACDTAYDPDKIVEQLEKLKKAEQDRSDDCEEEGCGDAEQIYDDGRSQGKFEAFGKAIQIVKGGGVK